MMSDSRKGSVCIRRALGFEGFEVCPGQGVRRLSDGTGRIGLVVVSG